MLYCYYMDFSSGCSYEQSLALLEIIMPERKKRIERMNNKEAVRKQILSGAFLLYCLGKTADVPVRDINLLYNSHGKPYLKNAEIYFNLSHSGDYAVAAVSDSDIGIDVEHLRTKRLNVAKRCFCKEEYEYILSAGSEQDQNIRFLEYWTMKEAFVKCCGAGLSIPLNCFQIIDRGSMCVTKFVEKNEEYDAYDGIFVKTFNLENGYKAAVCTFNNELEEMKIQWYDNANVIKVSFDDLICLV